MKVLSTNLKEFLGFWTKTKIFHFPTLCGQVFLFGARRASRSACSLLHHFCCCHFYIAVFRFHALLLDAVTGLATFLHMRANVVSAVVECFPTHRIRE